ncbi:MAG: hypothetical protein AAB133_05625, partial [Pseudomonadota bacterium]
DFWSFIPDQIPFSIQAKLHDKINPKGDVKSDFQLEEFRTPDMSPKILGNSGFSGDMGAHRKLSAFSRTDLVECPWDRA